MNVQIIEEITKNGRFVAHFINQSGMHFTKGFMSPYLRDRAIRKMKHAGVVCKGRSDF